jgi:5-carboxymethyl-2-hydroxymuconate isomerase
MPHMVILYTPNIDALTNMSALCRVLADTMMTVCDEQGKQVFPTGGVRVLAYPAAHFAVADGGAAGRAAGGSGEYAFAYFNCRMGKGRSEAVKKAAGAVLQEVINAHFAQLLASMHIGLTLQIDEGPEVFDAKMSSLHPLFVKP